MIGLFYSKISNRIFYAEETAKGFLVKYCDKQYPRTKKIGKGSFHIQATILELYEPLAGDAEQFVGYYNPFRKR
jgi:hypothetical protein